MTPAAELELRTDRTLAELERDALKKENAALRQLIDFAVNALTDSINCSGNDADTNMHWVRKLRQQADLLTQAKAK